ncbi:MAG: CHAT domain-containing protein [Nitrososphaeraceae archaeon]
MDSFDDMIIRFAKVCSPTEFVKLMQNTIPMNRRKILYMVIAKVLDDKQLYLHKHKLLEEGLEISILDNDRQTQMGYHGMIGNTQEKLEQDEDAIKSYQKAIDIAREIGDRRSEAGVLCFFGLIYDRLEKNEDAIKSYQKAIDIAREIGDRQLEANVYHGLGIIFIKSGNYLKCLEIHNHELEIVRELQLKEREVQCYIHLGMAYNGLGSHQEAISYYEKASYVLKNFNNKYLEASYYFGLGVSYQGLAELSSDYLKYNMNYSKSKHCYEKSLDLFKETNDDDMQLNCYVALDSVCHHLEEHQNATQYYEKALEIVIKSGDEKKMISFYTKLGGEYFIQGQNLKSRNSYQTGLDIAERLKDKKAVAKLQLELGTCFLTQGDYTTSKEHYEKALEIAEKLDDNKIFQRAYLHMGNFYYTVGSLPKAKEHYEKALEIAEKLDDNKATARCRFNLGMICLITKDSLKAKQHYEKALDIQNELRDQNELSIFNAGTGNLYYSIDNFPKAKEYYEKALEIAKHEGNKATMAKCLVALGAVYKSLGDDDRFKEYHDKALGLAKEIQDIDLQYLINLNLAKSNYLTNRGLAYDYLEQAIEIIDLIGNRILEEDSHMSFYDKSTDGYKMIVPLCVELDKKKEAFEYAEKSKSRTLLKLLSTTKLRIPADTSEKLKSLIESEGLLIDMLRQFQIRYLNYGTKSVQAPPKFNIQRVREQLDVIYESIKTIDPGYVALRRGDGATLDEIQEILRTREHVILVEYFVTGQFVLIFIITGTELILKTVALSEKQLNFYIDELLEQVLSISSDIFNGNGYTKLSEHLIKPISEFLKEKKIIYFVPHRNLHYLPIHSLADSDKPLIENYAITYLPSASTLKFLHKRVENVISTCSSFAAAKNEIDKVAIESEATYVAQIFNTNPFLSASKATVINNMQKDVLHFSCHAYFNSDEPLSSGIRLSDGLLSARDLFNLGHHVGTELVTLSACETGVNKTNDADELIGLSRAFLFAGAISIIVSLWSVETESTRDLMENLYKNLKDGKNKADSLREAQIKIMNKNEYSHPFFWAPFILVGEYR